MTDMLVKLYELPPLASADGTIFFRRAIAPEKHLVLAWVRQHFSEYWASETEVAFSRQPVSCFVAIEDGQMIGFACYETTARGFFGPTGVAENARGQGVGRELLLLGLYGLRELGYAYGIIGGVGPAEFYAKAVGATSIAGSDRGIYQGLLRKGSRE